MHGEPSRDVLWRSSSQQQAQGPSGSTSVACGVIPESVEEEPRWSPAGANRARVELWERPSCFHVFSTSHPQRSKSRCPTWQTSGQPLRRRKSACGLQDSKLPGSWLHPNSKQKQFFNAIYFCLLQKSSRTKGLLLPEVSSSPVPTIALSSSTKHIQNVSCASTVVLLTAPRWPSQGKSYISTATTQQLLIQLLLTVSFHDVPALTQVRLTRS